MLPFASSALALLKRANTWTKKQIIVLTTTQLELKYDTVSNESTTFTVGINGDLTLDSSVGGFYFKVNGSDIFYIYPTYIDASFSNFYGSRIYGTDLQASATVNIDYDSGDSGSAFLNIGVGTTSKQAIKFREGAALLTTPQARSFEVNDSNFYLTKGTAIRESVPGVLFTQTADKTVANTTTETSIVGTGVGTLTLPANFWIAGKTIRITMSGVYSTVAVTGDIITVKVKYGSTVLASKATTALVTGGTNLFWESEVLVTCRTTGGTGTVQVSGGIRYQIASSVTVSDELNNAIGTTTLDTTASGLFDVTVTHSAMNASNSVKSLVGTFEVLN